MLTKTQSCHVTYQSDLEIFSRVHIRVIMLWSKKISEKKRFFLWSLNGFHKINRAKPCMFCPKDLSHRMQTLSIRSSVITEEQCSNIHKHPPQLLKVLLWILTRFLKINRAKPCMFCPKETKFYSVKIDP
jgi:hypothetical protein